MVKFGPLICRMYLIVHKQMLIIYLPSLAEMPPCHPPPHPHHAGSKHPGAVRIIMHTMSPIIGDASVVQSRRRYLYVCSSVTVEPFLTQKIFFGNS